MQKALLIAEKPSLMRQIQYVYEKHRGEIPYDITFMAQTGHLITLLKPSEIEEEQKHWKWENLPFHPEEHGGWRYKVIPDTRKGGPGPGERLNAIKKAIRSGEYHCVINAGDPDQEGELLIRIVLEYLHNILPVKRFWTNDLTEPQVLNALKNLRDDDSDPMLINLYAAARGRQHSDYRFGMNISEAASLKMNTRVACGRVKTPILAIVCRREEEIRNFVPSTCYGVQIDYSGGFSGILFDKNEISADENEKDADRKYGVVRFDNKKDAEAIVDKLPDVARVLTYEKKRVDTFAPKLYKLATLQIDAGKLGINDARTLEIVQSLYERGLLTYPRTDCEYISSGENFRGTLEAISSVPFAGPYVGTITDAIIGKVRATKKWVNDKALEEAGHSAIKPTTKPVDFDKLNDEEQKIYSLVAKRFLAIFLPPIIQDKTQLVTDCGGRTFRSNGKTLIDAGFSILFDTKYADAVIPELNPGDMLNIQKKTISEKTTTCPRRFTSPDLIAVCENPGKYLDDPALKALGSRLKIGTSATRSSIIRQLITVDKYMVESKENSRTVIRPTENGEMIIKGLGDCDICKVDLTGIWEEKLESVRQGTENLSNFEAGMREHVEKLINDIKGKDIKPIGPSRAKSYKVIGKCPSCGKDLCEGEKGFFCLGFKDNPKCGVGMFKDVSGYLLSTDEFLRIMAGEEVAFDAKKNGRSFRRKIRYNLASCVPVIEDADQRVIGECPKCGRSIVGGESTFTCEGCNNVRGYRNLLNVTFSDDEIVKLLSGERVLKHLVKEGKEWDQVLFYDFVKKGISFAEPEKKKAGRDCPLCGEELFDDGRRLGCSCGFLHWKNFFGLNLDGEIISELYRDGITRELSGLRGKSGKIFAGRAMIDKAKKTVVLTFN